MPLRIFRSRTCRGANAIQVAARSRGCSGCSSSARSTCGVVLGYDALQIGLAFLPTTIAMGTLSIRYSERAHGRFGAARDAARRPRARARGLVAVRARAGARATTSTEVRPSMLLLGLGAGVRFPALMNLAMSGATPQDAGLASGLVNTTAQVGGALGLAVLATLAAIPHQNPAGKRSLDRGGLDGRLSACLLDRGRPRPVWDRARGDGRAEVAGHGLPPGNGIPARSG